MSNDAGDVSGPPPDEPYELPTIVPATEAERVLGDTVASPRLPSREPGAPRPTRTAPPATNTQQPATQQSTTRRVATPPAATPPAAPPRHAAPQPAQPVHRPAPVTAPAATQLRAPGRRARVRRVTRVLRHIDPWSTFKVALVFSAVAYIVALTSGVLLWRVADSTGTLANVERWFTQFGWETFELDGGEIFSNAWKIGLFGVVAGTGGAVLFVTLFNLVSDIVGGIRMTVLEEEVVERTVSSTRRYVVRNTGPGAAAASTTTSATWSIDDDDSESAGSGGTSSAEAAPATQQADPVAAARSSASDWSVD